MNYPYVVYPHEFFPKHVISYIYLTERQSLLLKQYEYIVFLTKKDDSLPDYDNVTNKVNTYSHGVLVKLVAQGIPFFNKRNQTVPRLISTPKNDSVLVEAVSEVKILSINLTHGTVDIEVQKPFRELNDIETNTILLELLVKSIEKVYKASPALSRELTNALFSFKVLDEFLDFAVEFLIGNKQINKQEFFDKYISKVDIERTRVPFVVSKLKDFLYNSSIELHTDTTQPSGSTVLPISASNNNQIADNRSSSLEETLDSKVYPEYVKKRIEEQQEKYKQLARDTGEKALTYRYIKFLQSIPWGIYDNDPLEFSQVKKELEELQYGMIEPKNKIEQLVAVSINSGKPLSGKTICIIGAPGVGKTMFAMNIATVLKRKFTKISLAGINDVTLLRGQIKGWIGAEPGLIIKALISAGSMNPVIVLDEIDKITGYHGEQVKSALLEILDPNQNHLFQDAWVDLPIDLSKIIFIATANYWRNIPLALEDRMEIIRISNYSLQEKFEISRRYIIPKVYEKTAVTEQEITIAEGALDKIVMSHKSDPGVRKIEQDLTELISKYVVTKVEGKVNGPFEVNEQNLSTFLILDEDGNNFDPDDKKIGQINVLSVTQIDGLSVSGRRNTIQVAAIPGKGELKYTGSLSDVKKESIDVAIGYLKTHAQQFDIPEDYFQKHDIFYHQSPLSTPKDGPSATIATTLCMLSVIKNLPIPQNIAVTGEMDLQGAAMPIGGVKDKIQSAVVDKVTVFVLPESNRSDYERDVPDEIKQSITVHFVKHVTECINIFFPEFKFER